jgi:TonB family protein
MPLNTETLATPAFSPTTAIAILLCVPAAVTAQPPEDAPAPAPTSDRSVLIEPEPLERVAPSYPMVALMDRREGWVALSFIVSDTGEVKEAMIEDSSGNETLERAAMNALTKWRYKPAMLDGRPIEHAMTRSVIRFQLDDVKGGASEEFVRQYRRIQTALKDGDLPRAEELLTELRYKERQSLYEDAWFWWTRSTYLEAANGSAEEQREALTRAIGYDEMYLTPEMFVSAAAKLFVLRTRDNDLSGALEIFERLKSTKQAQGAKNYFDVVPKLESAVREIDRAVAGNQVLMVNGRIGEHDYWVHPLLRRSFALGNIEGQLEHVSIRCERRNVTFTEVTDERTWTVPESYGKCSAYLKGAPGASFEFYEYPPSAAAAGAQ